MPKVMPITTDNIVELIITNNILALNNLFKQDSKFKNYICPENNYNLLGLAILCNASAVVICNFINNGVAVNGTIINSREISSRPLKAVPLLRCTPLHLAAIYELVLAGADCNFYDHDDVLWLQACRTINPRIYNIAMQATSDKASGVRETREILVAKSQSEEILRRNPDSSIRARLEDNIVSLNVEPARPRRSWRRRLSG